MMKILYVFSDLQGCKTNITFHCTREAAVSHQVRLLQLLNRRAKARDAVRKSVRQESRQNAGKSHPGVGAGRNMAGAPAAQSSSSQKPLGAAHGPTSTDGETRSAASDDELTDNGCDHPAAVVQRGSSAGGINDGGGGGGAAREGDVAAGPADEIVAPPSPLPADLDPESDESDEWEVVSGGSCDYHHFLELSPVVGRSAWDLAIAAENLSAVQAMVDDGYDVDTRDPFPGRRLFSPLHWAAQHDNMEAAEILIRGGAHASTTDLYGDTPLHISSEEGYFEVSRILVAGGAAVNARNDLQQTPLHLAPPKQQSSCSKLVPTKHFVITKASPRLTASTSR
ncbi:unnamed protein product [Ectocarpus fasciculatus]